MNEFPPIFDEDLNHVLQHVSAWESLRNARIFITGGTGFFGAWLLETFCHANAVLGLGAEATILSREPHQFLMKMPHLQNRADLRFMPGDVRALEPNTARSEKFEGGEKFTHFIHAATASGANPPLAPLEMFDVVLEGTRRVLDFAIENSSASSSPRMLFVSSGAVYGAQPRALSRVDEEYSGAPDCRNLSAAYGEGKRAGEWLCAAYAEKFGIEIPIARGFAFVGPHLPIDAHFAIGNFLRDARKGGPIEIQGDGTPVRSYLYAADLAVWLWEILLRGQSGRAYNVGSEDAHSILETAQIVADAFNPKPEIIVAGKPKAGVLPTRYVPSTQRAQGELGLRPIIQLPDGIARTLRFINTYF